jgi:flagella basal body P-ring formation protein FlgA
MDNGSERIIACIVLVLVCCTGAVAAVGIEVHVRPKIVVAEEEIKASDVFIYRADKNATHLRLGPDAGSVFGPQAALVPMWQISDLIPASIKQQNHNKVVSLVGSRAMYIPPNVTTQPMRTLFTQILENVAHTYGDSRERVEVEITYMPTALKAFTKPGANLSGSLSTELLSRRTTGSAVSVIRYMVQSGLLEGVITVEVSRYVPYFVADRKISTAEIVGSNQLQRKAFPVGKYPEALQSVDTTKFEARTIINPGEPFTIRNARIKPVIEPGDDVRVTLRRGAVQLRMPGNARAEGGLNEIVAVRLETGVIKECRVKAKGEVVLE